MPYPNSKKHEYWNHYIEQLALNVKFRNAGEGVTAHRLQQIKPAVFRDEDIWYDVLGRHGGNSTKPEEMKERYREYYDRMIGNFSGNVYELMIRHRLIKS